MNKLLKICFVGIWVLVAIIMVSCAGAGVNESLPQSLGADNFGPQEPSIAYNITATATDSSVVNVSVGTAAQDASQQGSTDQAQEGGRTGAVDNRPEISPDLSIPLP